jgi:hypothetical protein
MIQLHDYNALQPYLKEISKYCRAGSFSERDNGFDGHLIVRGNLTDALSAVSRYFSVYFALQSPADIAVSMGLPGMSLNRSIVNQQGLDIVHIELAGVGKGYHIVIDTYNSLNPVAGQALELLVSNI